MRKRMNLKNPPFLKNRWTIFQRIIHERTELKKDSYVPMQPDTTIDKVPYFFPGSFLFIYVWYTYSKIALQLSWPTFSFIRPFAADWAESWAEIMICTHNLKNLEMGYFWSCLHMGD